MVLLRYRDLSIKIQNGQRGRFILQSACMKMLGPWDAPSLSAQVQESCLCYLLPSAPSLANSSSLKRRESWQCCCALQYVALGTCVSGPARASWFCGLTVCTLPFVPSLQKLLHPSWCREHWLPRAAQSLSPGFRDGDHTHQSPSEHTGDVLGPATSPETGGSSLLYSQENVWPSPLNSVSPFFFFSFFTSWNSSWMHSSHVVSLSLLPPTFPSAADSRRSVSGRCFLSLFHLSLQLCLICFSVHKLCFKPQTLCFSFSKRFIKSTYKFTYLPFIISYFFRGNFSTLL